MKVLATICALMALAGSASAQTANWSTGDGGTTNVLTNSAVDASYEFELTFTSPDVHDMEVDIEVTEVNSEGQTVVVETIRLRHFGSKTVNVKKGQSIRVRDVDPDATDTRAPKGTFKNVP